MIAYNIELQYPINAYQDELITLENQSEKAVIDQFKKFNWCQHRQLQIKFLGGETSFTITNLQTGQTLRFTLLQYGKTDRLELMMESDIIAPLSKKDLFVMINRRIKDSIRLKKFERLELLRISRAKVKAKNYMGMMLGMSTKDLFSMMNRRIKDYITFERLSIQQAEEYLQLFLHHHIDALEDEYKHKILSKKVA